jgi:hypothetical protein
MMDVIGDILRGALFISVAAGVLWILYSLACLSIGGELSIHWIIIGFIGCVVSWGIGRMMRDD